ncbi:diguanylate cyclase/phosphodiesterase (GGDEF & EAL domains) with PAS/PAC sensor(s) [Pseudoalteromonas luteoviolacea B = ATCC 29581]|nr:diguanylate cyclase/phosphodiesterase (GGDEF & EAL domains) with PAS/PAC sensor(s) [Pseudoalteromonas luteoviolacea B = ATCC 29581]
MLSEKKIKLESKTEQLAIINQFSSSLLHITKLNELFEYVTREVVSKLGFVDCVIYLKNESGTLLQEVASMGVGSVSEFIDENQTNYQIEITQIPISEGITGYVASSQKPYITGDVSKEARYVADSRPALSELCVPLIFESETLGVIDCEHPERDYFTDAHVQILSTVAHLLSAKIYQLRTMANLRETIAQLNEAQLIEQSLLKIANVTYSSQMLGQFYEDIYQVISALLPADNFFIGLYDTVQDTLEIDFLVEAGIKCDAHHKVSKDQLKDTASYYVLTRGQSLLCDEHAFASHIDQGDFTLVGRPPKSWLGVPFQVNENIKGVIVIQSYQDESIYDEHHQSILTYISRQVAMAIDRQQSKQALEHRALHDELTGLANRYLLIEHMKHAILCLERTPNEQLHALLYLDFDRFKSINDSLGHDVGDRFLVAICDVIKSCIRKTDTFSRLGGDEFAIFMENVQSKQQVAIAIERIVQALSRPLHIDSHVLQASTSIGVAFTHSVDDEALELLQQADAAMYEAKSSGRGQIRYFNNAMRKKLKRQADIENDLQKGIKNQEFELYYQPIFSLNNPKVVSFEALVRWHHPRNGLVSPLEFIPVAEQTGQIIELDLHLLRLAAKQLYAWQCEGVHTRITVNVSSRHFASIEFVKYIHQLYTDYNLNKGSLCLEITESGLIENLSLATKIIQGLAPLGVKLYLDDFGTGYSALGYLHQLPIHVIKIDKSFVDQLTNRSNPLVDAILSLARSLELDVVAEGIENPKQWALLKRKGCQFGQGYLVSRPLNKVDALMFYRNYDHVEYDISL